MQDLCALLERISKTTGTERKKRTLTNFIDQWRQAHKKLHPTDADTTVSNKFYETYSSIAESVPVLNRFHHVAVQHKMA